ncbi:YbaK/EbsC family protein [Pseudactinotalea sp. Z1739]|uniref:YbaK/EbsC family protein n=1 Tax=Pseudactinotalea sp. Z1739 TaxID=3413028 RepID=UPI003C7BCD25
MNTEPATGTEPGTDPRRGGESDPVLRVRAAAEGAGVRFDLVRLDEHVPTAAAAAQALGCTVAQIANSLIFEADGEPLLVIASGAHRVDVAKVATDLGYAKVRRAGPDFVLAHTGQQVGGVAPFGHPAPVRTVIDEDLATHEQLWAGGGDDFTMLSITFADLVRSTGGQVRRVR